MFVRDIWLGIFTWDQPAAVNETEEATAGVAGKGRSSRIVWLGQKSNQRSELSSDNVFLCPKFVRN